MMMDTAILADNFEQLYLAVREREQRIYQDVELRSLPVIAPSHVHYNEWLTRARSANRLVNYLKKKPQHLSILEIGCGNGWLSAKMAALAHTEVTGLDINEAEIRQAQRVFKKDNLRFIFNEDSNYAIPVDIKFDVIVFAASLAYFKAARVVLQAALDQLNPGGEIHLIDNPLYQPNQITAAAQRGRDYYTKLGFSQMADKYFHHPINDVKTFNYRVLFDPAGILNRLGKKDPFYWICITK